MPIFMLGVNHTTAPLDLRERLYVSAADRARVLADLRRQPRVHEAVLLSTCNRTEVYCTGAPTLLPLEALAAHAGLPGDALQSHSYAHEDLDAARHLFRVATGLDSQVLGESEILGQVADALEDATTHAACGRQLGTLFQHALTAGKRARTETVIGQGARSVGRVAAELARALFPDLRDRPVLVLGAGRMAEVTARHLVGLGAQPIFVANRTHDHAISLAKRLNGRAVNYTDVGDILAQVDILISSTSAPHVVLNTDAVAHAMTKRPDRPLFLIDIAVPRDIDPAAGALPNVHLYDIDHLQTTTDCTGERRCAEIPKVAKIIGEELERWRLRQAGLDVAPVIAALHNAFAAVRDTELARAANLLASLTPAQQQAVEELTASMLKKILHTPTVRLKEMQSRDQSNPPVPLLCELFDLSPAAPEEHA